MSDLVKNILRFILFILFQVYVLNKIPPLHQYITPILYFLFILWLPFYINRFWLLVIGFITGLSLDYFTGTPGLHAAACVLVAYLRPIVISLLKSKETQEFSYKEPSPKALGRSPYLVYILILTLAHNGYIVFLEWLSFGSFFHFIIKVIATSAISILLILITEMLFSRTLKFKTNVS